MKTPFPNSGRRGFSLVEVTLALAIVVFCLTSLIGLLMVGLSANKTSASQSAANTILASVASDLRATPSTATQSLLYGISIPSNPITTASTTSLYVNADGKVLSGAQNLSTYLLTVTFLAPTSTAATGANTRTATFADIKVSWPAAVSAANATGSVETFFALDRN